MTDLLASPLLKEIRNGHQPDLTSSSQVITVSVVPAPVVSQADRDRQFLAQVRAMVAGQGKQRLTIFVRPDGTEAIKANYGHNARLSLDPGPEQVSTDIPVPTFLLHGTSSDALTNILRQGLLPMGRHAVHATACRQAAMLVAQRHMKPGAWPVILRIRTCNSGDAWSCSADTWLTPAVNPSCLDLDLPTPGPKTWNAIPCAGLIVFYPRFKQVCLVCTPPSDTSPGVWGFPKGKRHSGEGLIACAFRECEEETRLRLSDFRRVLPPFKREKLQEFSERGNVAVQFLVAIASGPNPVGPKDPNELAAVEWVHLDEARTLLTHKNRRNLLDSAWRLVEKSKPPKIQPGSS